MESAGVTGTMLSEEEIAKASGLQLLPEEVRKEGEVNRAAWRYCQQIPCVTQYL